MRRLSILLGIVTSILLSLAGLAAPQEKIAPTKACQTLVDLDLSGVTDKRVHIESAKEMQLQGGDFCEVKGTIEPKIGFVVQLPLQNWTGRFLQIGCGGLCGHIPNEYAQTYACGPLANGEFAIAMTDMGHEGPGPEFGDDPQLRVDLAYRGVHQTALAAKAFIAAFYGRAPEHSYFLGCSDGGREALMEVQRFPEDFDGVTAGSSAEFPCPKHVLSRVECTIECRRRWKADYHGQGSAHIAPCCADSLHSRGRGHRRPVALFVRPIGNRLQPWPEGRLPDASAG